MLLDERYQTEEDKQIYESVSSMLFDRIVAIDCNRTEDTSNFGHSHIIHLSTASEWTGCSLLDPQTFILVTHGGCTNGPS